MIARTTKLARWNDHRHGCDRCAPLAPGADPDAACATGRPLMLEVMVAATEVVMLRANATAAPQQQTQMWD
jgi:hypothetical protein